MSRRKGMQAKHVSDAAILSAVRRLSLTPWPFPPLHPTPEHDARPRWVNRWELAEQFPGVPEKVLRAKLKRMTEQDPARRVLQGCACDCRGDFYLVEDERRSWAEVRALVVVEDACGDDELWRTTALALLDGALSGEDAVEAARILLAS